MPRDKTKSWFFLAGALLGATSTWFVQKFGGRRPAGARRVPQLSGGLLRTEGGRETVYDPALGSFIQVRDRTEELRASAAPEAGQEEVDIFLRHRDEFDESPAPDGIRLLREIPPPGGFGAGVRYLDGQLLFRDYTAAAYNLLAPEAIGGRPRATLLYMTATNRASKGCEALLSFFESENFNCVFRIWDWATPPQANGSHFVFQLTYPQLAPYLIPGSADPGTGSPLTFNSVWILSVTRRVSGEGWRNEVYLYNQQDGVRDRVWSYDFQWPTRATDKDFWWGPIFEVFPDNADYGSTNLVGFWNTLVVQDGSEYQLSDSNSRLEIPKGNGLDVVWRSYGTNSGMICR